MTMIVQECRMRYVNCDLEKRLSIRGKDGSPLKQETFRGELNKLAYEQNIVDKSGEIYRFHNYMEICIIKSSLIINL